MTIAPPGRRPAPPQPRDLIKEARRRQHRRWLATGVAVAVVVTGVTAALTGWGSGAGPRPLARHPRPAAPAPAAAPRVTVSQTSLPAGNSLNLAVGYRAVWVTGIGVTYQVDEATGRIVRTIPTPGTSPDGCRSGVTAGAGAVWVTHGCQGIYRIDPRSGRVIASLRVPDVGDAIAVAGGLLWVTSYRGDLLRIQPRTGQILGRPVPVGFGDWTMVPDAWALWVTSYGSGPPGGTAIRVDLATGAVQRFGNLDVQAVGASSLWTPQVQRIDPATGRVIASLPMPSASQVTFWHGSAWALTVGPSLAFVRIDPGTDQVTGPPVPLGKPFPDALAGTSNPTAIAAGPGELWVLELDPSLLFRLRISGPLGDGTAR